jgi:hypothetical protein
MPLPTPHQDGAGTSWPFWERDPRTSLSASRLRSRREEARLTCAGEGTPRAAA